LEGSEDGLEMVVVVEKGVYIYVFLTFTYWLLTHDLNCDPFHLILSA
jgi:hypothetical protein